MVLPTHELLIRTPMFRHPESVIVLYSCLMTDDDMTEQ
jgi:hypothetical protein